MEDHPTDGGQPELSRNGVPDYTLGDLLRDLQSSERCYQANTRTADDVEAKDGSVAAMWWRLGAAAQQFVPDPDRMPGIDRIEVWCDAAYGGTGLTSNNLRRIRAKLCQLLHQPLLQVEALPLDQAAAALETNGRPELKEESDKTTKFEYKECSAQTKEADCARERIEGLRLSDRQLETLQAMLQLKAFDRCSKCTIGEIANAVERNAKEESFKKPITDLVKRGLVVSQQGARGGCWLSTEGRELAKSLPL